MIPDGVHEFVRVLFPLRRAVRSIITSDFDMYPGHVFPYASDILGPLPLLGPSSSVLGRFELDDGGSSTLYRKRSEISCEGVSKYDHADFSRCAVVRVNL